MSDEDRTNGFNLRRATKRLNRELSIIAEDPIPGIDIRASKDNILKWHFVIHGEEDTPYYGGMYHGKLIFPSNFPFDPPSIIFLTPNGRFKTNERICFSISDFHPEQWKPSYSVVDLLYGVREFMHEDTETTGSIETSESEKRQLAKSSSIHNGKDNIFYHLFPSLPKERINQQIPSAKKEISLDAVKSPKRFKSIFSRRKVKPPSQNVPQRISPIYSEQQNFEENLTLESIELEESPVYYFSKLGKLPSSPIESIGDTFLQTKPSPEETIRQIPSPETFLDGENTSSSDEITLPLRTQSPTSTEITSPPTHLTPVPIGITPPAPPGETAKLEETFLKSKEIAFSRKESSPLDEIIKTFGKEPSGTTQEQRTNTLPPHTTHPVPRPMFDPTKQENRTRPLKEKVRSPLQDISQSPKQQKTNFHIPENNEMEERPMHYFGEYKKSSPEIRYRGYSQINLPSSPNETIPQQTSSPKMKISTNIEQVYTSIGVVTPVSRDILDRQEEENSLRHSKSNLDTRENCSMVSTLVVGLLLFLGLALLALLLTKLKVILIDQSE